MHPAIIQLLDLHRINQNRQLLQNDRLGRSSKRQQADAALEKYKKLHEAAGSKVSDQDALIRQYTADVERCDAEILKLRSQQMEAKTNKEYLDCINGVETAKAEKKLREESLENLQANVDELKASADKAAAQLADIQAKYDKFIAEHQEPEASGSSLEEVERIYAEKRQGLDAKFLEVYERLIAARHKTPLLEVNPATRATPLGQIISHNDCERIRNGELVTDPMTNGILYMKDVAEG